MYALWMQNSLNKKIADEVIVYQEDKQNLGVVTLKHEAECTRIGLIAVEEATRGKQIGSHLLDAVKQEAAKQGKTSLEVATQLDNEIACRFYEKNNFNIKKIEFIYHIWL
jgi:dTDP-4-amino-4,6-dideoxy-D-galactose acyltransferase